MASYPQYAETTSHAGFPNPQYGQTGRSKQYYVLLTVLGVVAIGVIVAVVVVASSQNPTNNNNPAPITGDDLCADVNCKNGGSCKASTGKCVCVGGYTGATCGTAPAACQNKGTRSATTGKCKCVDGFTGDLCQVPPESDLCTDVSCQNEGTCDPATGACVCVNDYSGDLCEVAPEETPVDLCANVVCQHSGTCVKATGACKCVGGYTGAKCTIAPSTSTGTISTDLCAKVTCQNGGTCVATTGKCNCKTGFTGTLCETPQQTDLCASVKCQNEGTCVTTTGKCNCKTGFTGTLCETPQQTDPCASIKCLNGGTCSAGKCTCATGYSGDTCQTADTKPNTTVTCPSSKLASGNSNHNITAGGTGRMYILHVPSAYKGDTAVPLIIDFHPIGGSASQWQSGSPYPKVVDGEGVITVFPDGKSGPMGQAWNVEGCCVDNVDDVAFAREIVKDVSKLACIDPKRIYAVGFSMGGGMTHYAACHAADIFAAGAPAAFDLLKENINGCKPARPLTMIIFRGTADNVVPYAGGLSQVVSGHPINFLGAVESMKRWASFNKCTDSAVSKGGNCQGYSACADGVEVQLCTKQGGGHEAGDASYAWPILKKYKLP